MIEASIYKPAKTAMQSGMAKTKAWVLEYKGEGTQFVDPLMGWTGNRDTSKQVKLYFSNKEEAIAYAHHHQLAYTIKEPKAAKLQPKSYGDNFKATKVNTFYKLL
jgi:hypothetical protein